MRFRVTVLAFLLLGTLPALASALGTQARASIPADVQQIITVDYRALRNSPSAVALKDRVLPPSLKSLEKSIQDLGIAPEAVEQIAFASVRDPKGGLRLLGVAQGSFTRAQVLQRLRARKVIPHRYHNTAVYPMGNGMDMIFADASTLVFGDPGALRQAMDTRDGEAASLDSNSQMIDMMSDVDSGTVWSVLDSVGTQNMLQAALGQAAALGDYAIMRKRLLGSRYSMDFSQGVDFDLNVATSDAMTAATLSSLAQAAVMFRKNQTTGAEKAALENVSVNSDNSDVKVHFESDNQRFQALLSTELFSAISH